MARGERCACICPCAGACIGQRGQTGGFCLFAYERPDSMWWTLLKNAGSCRWPALGMAAGLAGAGLPEGVGAHHGRPRAVRPP